MIFKKNSKQIQLKQHDVDNQEIQDLMECDVAMLDVDVLNHISNEMEHVSRVIYQVSDILHDVSKMKDPHVFDVSKIQVLEIQVFEMYHVSKSLISHFQLESQK